MPYKRLNKLILKQLPNFCTFIESKLKTLSK